MYSTVKMITLLLSLITSGYLIDTVLEQSHSYLLIVILPIFLTTSLITILSPNRNGLQQYRISFTTWLCAMSLTCLLIVGVYTVRNYSTTLYDVEYNWEEGIRMTFMKNGRVRIANENIVSTSVSYARYRQQESFIILEDDVMWGMAELKDTLHISSSGLQFSLKTPWRGKDGDVMMYRQ